jgi:phosphate transport system substrate-binding protein
MTTVSTDQAFEFFCESDQADIAGVRQVMQDDIVAACDDAGRRPLALRVGTDVVAIVTNPNNDFVNTLTLEELETLFTARRWSEVHPEWPDEPIQRFIPPTDSSAVDLFVERVLDGETEQLLLVPNLITVDDRGRQAQGITTNPYALGFMEYSAYQRNAGLLNLVAIADIVPDDVTIEDGTYPLLRPLLLYVDADTLEDKSQVAAFLNFYLTNAHVAMEPLDYVPASSQALDEARTTLRQAVNPPP